MSGHSKWANIKRKKGATDAARAKIFTKISKEIMVAVRDGGADPQSNSKLATCIAKAKSNNIPNDNIQRLLKKASGETSTVNYEEIIYEGYGAGGVAFIVKTLTDNKNRTAGDVRHFFDKNGGSLGTNGCVSYMFETKGLIIVDGQNLDEEEFTLQALDFGAEDLEYDEEGNVFIIKTTQEDFNSVREQLENAKFNLLEAEVKMIPVNTVNVDEMYKNKLNKLIEMLDENDDVQEVYHNASNLDDDEE